MKKYWYCLLACIVMILTGCGSRGISAEDAGELFVDRFVYQKEETKFANQFYDGSTVGNLLDGINDDFEQNFASGLTSAGVEVPTDEEEQLIQELLQQMKKKTSYKITKVDETKTGATITYYVTGLDFVSAMKDMTRELIQEIFENPEIAEDEQKTLETTFTILEERVEAIKVKSDPVEISIHFEKENGKWYIPEDQEDAVYNLFLAFIAGVKDEDTMNDEMDEALSTVANEFVDSLNK